MSCLAMDTNIVPALCDIIKFSSHPSKKINKLTFEVSHNHSTAYENTLQFFTHTVKVIIAKNDINRVIMPMKGFMHGIQ